MTSDLFTVVWPQHEPDTHVSTQATEKQLETLFSEITSPCLGPGIQCVITTQNTSVDDVAKCHNASHSGVAGGSVEEPWRALPSLCLPERIHPPFHFLLVLECENRDKKRVQSALEQSSVASLWRPATLRCYVQGPHQVSSALISGFFLVFGFFFAPVDQSTCGAKFTPWLAHLNDLGTHKAFLYMLCCVVEWCVCVCVRARVCVRVCVPENKSLRQF